VSKSHQPMLHILWYLMCRCAAAFNVSAVCLVGSRQFNTFGSHGSDVYLTYLHFETLEECCTRLKTDYACTIIGIEIMDSAQPVHAAEWPGSVAFMLGNEGQGLSNRQIRLCDSFVYIPQYGAGTASLNVAVAASIVLHHFAIWAGFPESKRYGQKYEVGERPFRTWARGVAPSSKMDVNAESREEVACGNIKETDPSIANDYCSMDFSEAGVIPAFACQVAEHEEGEAIETNC
jgi:tRNA(Leu) C34 or U34 (ribose-2'-O)-methylase TrmL